MVHHYYVPFVGSAVGDGSIKPAHIEDVEADASTYRCHHVANRGVYVAAREKLDAYEALADDEDSGVERYDAADGEYPAPDADDSPEEYECDADGCDASFASKASLNAHKGVHSR